MHTLVSLILLSLALASFQTHADQVSAVWPRFRDEAYLVSFAYPPELRAAKVPVESLHIDGLVNRVSVVSNDPLAAWTADPERACVHMRRSQTQPARAVPGREFLPKVV
jgi:hypothetical protein